jgi:hypothetical protein
MATTGGPSKTAFLRELFVKNPALKEVEATQA